MKEKPPPPSIKVSNIDPLGLVTISFNQEFLVPDDWWNIDYSHVLSFGLKSSSDGSLVMGNFVKPPKERILKGRGKNLKYESSKSIIEDCIADDCDAQEKGFSWYLHDHTNRQM